MLQLFRIFAVDNGFVCLFMGCAMKRESGESPGQSRCCKSHYCDCKKNHWFILKMNWEGVVTEISQKTCHSSIKMYHLRGRVYNKNGTKNA
jgi:hypothetical protein